MAALTYLMRRFMRKRMEKHIKWMEEQQNKEQQPSWSRHLSCFSPNSLNHSLLQHYS